MYIVSEITGKKYDSVEACEKAETEFLAAQAAEKKKAEALRTERKARAAEVEEAIKHAADLLTAFNKDYGAFHCSLTSDSFPFFPWLF